MTKDAVHSNVLTMSTSRAPRLSREVRILACSREPTSPIRTRNVSSTKGQALPTTTQPKLRTLMPRSKATGKQCAMPHILHYTTLHYTTLAYTPNDARTTRPHEHAPPAEREVSQRAFQELLMQNDRSSPLLSSNCSPRIKKGKEKEEEKE